MECGVNWERSKALTALKRDFLLEFFAQRQDFFLTGGTALSVFYLDHRKSYDLDLFTPQMVDWFQIDALLALICQRIGAEHRSVTKTPLFCRHELVRGQEKEIVDLVVEQVPQIEEKKNHFGQIIVDTPREIGINKICMLVSRSEIKDVIDLLFLSRQGFDVLANVTAAKRKEASLEPALLSYLLSQLHVAEMPSYLIQPISSGELTDFIANLKRELSEIAFRENGSGK